MSSLFISECLSQVMLSPDLKKFLFLNRPRFLKIQEPEKVQVVLHPGTPDWNPESLSAELNSLDGFVETVIGDLITISVPFDRLPQLETLSFKGSAFTGPSDDPLLSTSVSQKKSGSTFLGTWADSLHQAGITGKGVIVGVIDDGFTVNHGDYKQPDGKTRILAIWNQGTSTPSRYPVFPTYSYGTEWFASDLNSGLVTGIPASSHGSSCLSIACGDGSQSGLKGMAPESDIILVIRKPGATMANTIDAFNYICKKAKAVGKPVVVSYSFGSQFGPHDGSRANEKAIDTLSGPGSLFSLAAGNSGGQMIYVSGQLPAQNAADTIRFSITSNPGSANQSFSNNLWYPVQDSLDLKLIGPSGTVYGPFKLRTGFDTLSTSEGFLYAGNNTDPVSQRNVIDWELINYNNRKVKTGNWKAVLISRYQVSGSKFDNWVYASTVSGTYSDHVSSQKVITLPGTSIQAVTSGAYDKSSGSRLSNSSTGPTRDGRIKPEICAPSNVSTAGGSLTGTSAAAPHTAGALALLLQLAPDLTPSQAKTRLQQGASTDSQTGIVPGNSWGYGKLNAFRAAEPFLQPDVPLPVKITSFSGKTTGGQLLLSWTTLDETGLSGYILLAQQETGTWSPVADWKWNEGLRAKGGQKNSYSWLVSLPVKKTFFRLDSQTPDGKILPGPSTFFTPGPETVWEAPEAFSVSPCYPNPANPGTSIRVHLPAPGPVRVSIVTLTGQVLSEILFPGVQTGDELLLKPETLHAASGLYLLRVSFGGRAITQKLVILN